MMCEGKRNIWMLGLPKIGWQRADIFQIWRVGSLSETVAFERLRQEEHEFEVNLGYMVSLVLAWAM